MTDTEQRLTGLLDREAIRDCMYRYCRGIDRADEAALRSAYWPDATDQHGRYSGPVEGFFELVKQGYSANPRNVHQVSNILIEFESETVAVVESYFNALQRSRRRTAADSRCCWPAATATGSRSAAANGASPNASSSTTGWRSRRPPEQAEDVRFGLAQTDRWELPTRSHLRAAPDCRT